MTPVRLIPAAPQSRVKHSTTEPLRSLCVTLQYKDNFFHDNVGNEGCILSFYNLLCVDADPVLSVMAGGMG